MKFLNSFVASIKCFLTAKNLEESTLNLEIDVVPEQAQGLPNNLWSNFIRKNARKICGERLTLSVCLLLCVHEQERFTCYRI